MRFRTALLSMVLTAALAQGVARAIPSGIYDYHPLRHEVNRLKPVEVYKYLTEYVGFLDRVERTLTLVESNLMRQNVFNQLDSRMRVEVLQDLRDMQNVSVETRKKLLDLSVNDHDHYDLATAEAIHERFIANRDALDRMITRWITKDIDYQYAELVNLRGEADGFERGWYAHMVATYAYVDRLLMENRIDIRQ